MTTPLEAAEPAVQAAGSGDDRPAYRGTLKYALSKVGGALFSIAMVIVGTFFVFRLLPGHPVRNLAQGRNMTPTQLALERHRLGLDKSLIDQFFDFVGKTLHLDLGTSYEYKRPVLDLIGERFPATLLLAGGGLVIAVGLGIWQGQRAGWRRGSRFDRVSTGVSLVLWSMPTFWLGLLLLMVFAVGIGPIPGLFPTRGIESVDAPDGFAYVLDVGMHLVLPCLTLVAVVLRAVPAGHALVAAGGDQPGLRERGPRQGPARRRGTPPPRGPQRAAAHGDAGLHAHRLRGRRRDHRRDHLQLAGARQLFYEAISVPDLTLMQGTFMLFTVAVILMNTLADVLYRFLDPRVRSA